MADVQLVLSGTGGDFAPGFASILENVKPGDTLVAQVRESLGNGQYELMVGGTRITAESSIPLQELDLIQLEVKAISPRIVLSMLPMASFMAPDELLVMEMVNVNRGMESAVASQGEDLNAIKEVFNALRESLPAASAKTLDEFLVSSRGQITLNERNLFVAQLFAKNGILPSPEHVTALAERVFGNHPAFLVPDTILNAFPAGSSVPSSITSTDPSNDITTTLMASIMSSLSKNQETTSAVAATDLLGHENLNSDSRLILQTFLKTAIQEPGKLRELLENYYLGNVEKFIRSRPELMALDRALNLVDLYKSAVQKSELLASPGTNQTDELLANRDSLKASSRALEEIEHRLSEAVRRVLSDIKNSPVQLNADVMGKLDKSLATMNVIQMRESLSQIETFLLSRFPEMNFLREAWQAHSHLDRQDQFELLNGLARFINPAFVYSEFLLPMGNELVPTKFKAIFVNDEDAGTEKNSTGKVERIVIDLVLSRLNRIVGELTIKGNNLSLVFRAANRKVEKLFEDNQGEIEKALAKLGFDVQSTVGPLKKYRHPLLEEMPELSTERGWIDVRA